MMKIKIILATIALVLSAATMADFTPVSEGYELSLSDLRLPRNNGGSIAFRTCSSCNYETRLVSSDARWEINGKATTLKQFRERMAKIADREAQWVTVIDHIELNRVTAVSVYILDTDVHDDD
jgi:hypothetical protein